MDHISAKKKQHSVSCTRCLSFFASVVSSSAPVSGFLNLGRARMSRDSNMLSSERMRFESTVGDISAFSLRTKHSAGSTSQSNSAWICDTSPGYSTNLTFSWSPLRTKRPLIAYVSIHALSRGFHPSFSGSMYTMPQRETVAGEATSRSMGSNIMLITSVIAMISPDIRQSFLLSSRTVFMFSIQIASTGPSNSIHLRSSGVPILLLAAAR
mmetsp:Transcript_4693/g.10432  ORF Transcript_4693/g.10432 Transcript_4693/m.10432 type:complete len:211 (+) Transcript_4693:5655-6287(+)